MFNKLLFLFHNNCYCVNKGMRSTPTVQLPGSVDTQLTAFPNLTTIPASPPQNQSEGLFPITSSTQIS